MFRKVPAFVIILLLSGVNLVFAGEWRMDTTVKTVIEQRTISLRGGIRSTFEGASRTVIPIALPPGTVSWYYSFTTSTGASGVKTLNLLTQLSALVADPSGLSGTLISNFRIPQGSAAVDVYLLDQYNTTPFIQKGNFNHYPAGSCKNTSQGTIKVDRLITPCYLGFRNVSKLDEVMVTVEVAALVVTRTWVQGQQEQTDMNQNMIESAVEWTSEAKTQLEEHCKSWFASAGSESDLSLISNCFVQKVSASYTIAEYNKVQRSNRGTIESIMYNCCFENGKAELFTQRNKFNELISELNAASTMKDYAAQEEIIGRLIDAGAPAINWYGALASCQLFQNKVADAKLNLQAGLKAKPLDYFLNWKLANYFLVTGDVDQAISLYKQYKNTKVGERVKLKDWYGQDLSELKRLGLVEDGIDRVKAELRIR